MVLPFGLGTNVTPTPTAPPVEPGVVTIAAAGAPPITSPYIDFIVVNGDDRYMIRCERKAVLETSVELAKIIHAGPNSGRKNDNHFQISNVDKHDFELIVRFLETKFIKFRNHLHMLKILELADRFNCPDLVIYCIKELDLHLTSATVLDVFRSLWYYNSITPNNKNQVITNQIHCKKKCKSSYNPSPFTAEDYAVALLNNSLQLIDMHAELILTNEKMTELRFEELEMLAKREALQLHSEIVLFTCLADWSIEECKRKNLDPSSENKRRVLGPLCYTPRYLTMTSKEFHQACDRVELLDPVEISLVSDAIENKKIKVLTPEQILMLEKFRTPRPEFAKMPVYLSDRSNPKNYPKKMRKTRKSAEEESCWDSFTLNCITIFACIFD